MKRLRYASPASRDISEILSYIARDNSSAANKLAGKISRECKRIAQDPMRGMHHEDLPERFLVYRIGNYLIIYRTDEIGVLILRVVHGARDLGSLFSDR